MLFEPIIVTSWPCSQLHLDFLCSFCHTSVGHFDLAKRSWSSETASALQIVSIFWAETVVSSSTLVHERLDVQLLLSRSQLLQLQRHLGLMLQTLRHKYLIHPVAPGGCQAEAHLRFRTEQLRLFVVEKSLLELFGAWDTSYVYLGQTSG